MRPVSAGDESGKLVKLLLEVPLSRSGAVLARIADLAARNNLVINIDGNKPAAKVFASEGMARKTLGLGPAVPGREASRKRGSGADTGALKEELARLADELVSSATAQKEANDMIGAQTQVRSDKKEVRRLPARAQQHVHPHSAPDAPMPSPMWSPLPASPPSS